MLFGDNLCVKVNVLFHVKCITIIILLQCSGRRIPIVNIFVTNLESRLQNDEGYALVTIPCSYFITCLLYRQNTVSAIISSQIADAEDTTVDLDDENIELRIDIGMVAIYFVDLLPLIFVLL